MSTQLLAAAAALGISPFIPTWCYYVAWAVAVVLVGLVALRFVRAGKDSAHTYSNARSEGYNRLAKHQGRNAFGFGNTTNQTRRIRWPALANTGEPQPQPSSSPHK